MRCGIDRPEVWQGLLAGKRTGVIASSASFNARGEHSSEVIRRNADVRAFFALEHGFRGQLAAGAAVCDLEEDGIPVYSLYDGNGTVLPDDIDDIVDVLVFDIQDLGLRFYTYIASLRAVISASAEHSFRIVVLDRPNPFGRRVIGSPLTEDYFSFVGPDALPVMYSLTFGELSLWYARRLDAPLPAVVGLEGWDCGMWPFLSARWYPTSPNIRSFEAAFLYAGMCFTEGTSLSEGRGTDYPFQLVGAPFIDSDRLLASLPPHDGFQVSKADFIPRESKWKGEPCHGVMIRVEDYSQDPVAFAVRLLSCIFSLFPEAVLLGDSGPGARHIDRLMGEGGANAICCGCEELLHSWKQAAQEFSESVKDSYIYHLEDLDE